MPRGKNRLIEKRNAAIYRRWLYWTEEQRLRLDDTLIILSEDEFFLSEDRIMRIIRNYVRTNGIEADVPVSRRVPRLTAAHKKLLNGNK